MVAGLEKGRARLSLILVVCGRGAMISRAVVSHLTIDGAQSGAMRCIGKRMP